MTNKTTEDSQPLYKFFYPEEYATCTHCGSSFKYGGADSPLIKESLWKRVCKYYGITKDEEKERQAKLFKLMHDDPENRGVIQKENQDKYHVFFCLTCMETALHRKITLRDLGDSNEFNREFITLEMQKHKIRLSKDAYLKPIGDGKYHLVFLGKEMPKVYHKVDLHVPKNRQEFLKELPKPEPLQFAIGQTCKEDSQ